MSYMMEKCSIRPVTKKFHAQLWFFLFSMAKKNKKTFNAKEFIEFLGEGQLKLFQNYREKKSKPKENVTDLLNQYTDLGLLHKQHEDKIFLIRYERMPQIFFESGNNSKNKWKKILELYFERESSFRRVIAVLLSSLPRESISIKEIKINASIPMPTADHIIRILRYAGILKKIESGIDTSKMRINLKALNEFRKNLEERTIPKKKIIYTPEIFIMYLWKIYKEVRNSKNAGKIPISSLEEKFYNKFRLGNDEFRKLMRICGYIYPENLSFYQISEIVAKKFNKKPFYIENIPYFFISMEKPFRNPYKRQKEDKQGKLTSYIGGGEGR